MVDTTAYSILSKIKTVYQPIIDLNTGRFVAQEALSRGEQGTEYESPLAMLDFFNQKNQTSVFDIACHTRALQNYKKDSIPLLFLNIENVTMMQDSSHMEWLSDVLDEHGLDKSDIVLEVCERFYDLDNTARLKCFKRYSDYGYALALDDIDTSMLSISDMLLCDWTYIKLTTGLIRDIDKSDEKKAFVKSMMSFARFKRMRVIAEGVETKSELRTLIELQVDYAQGYLIGRPDVLGAERDYQIESLVQYYQRNRLRTAPEEIEISFVGQLMEERECLPANMRCGDVLECFKRNNYDSLCFTNSSEGVAGFISKGELYRAFSTQFGFSLYSNKSISSIYNHAPLIVNYHAPIKQVLEGAMARHEKQIYDDIIVANNGKYLGIVSMQKVITAYNEQDTRKATQLNPLTALPGNNIINNNIRKFMNDDALVFFTYADLSDFKAYNDFYGFENGDAVIRRTAEILTSMFEALPHNSFVGHIGGDDFVCMCEFPQDNAAQHRLIKRTLEGIVDTFEKAKPVFYSKSDYQLGYIKASNRHGKYEECALTNINLACYYGRLKRFDTLENIAEYIAGIKRQSKMKKISNYIIKYEKEDNVIDLMMT